MTPLTPTITPELLPASWRNKEPSYVNDKFAKYKSEGRREARNFYADRDKLIDDIKAILIEGHKRSDAIYEYLLENEKIPLSNRGKQMSEFTVKGFINNVAGELGYDPRGWSMRSKIREQISLGLSDDEICKKLKTTKNTIRNTRNQMPKHFRKGLENGISK